MALQKITIILFPEGSEKVKQFRLPRFLLVFFLLLLVCYATSLSWIIRDYQMMKSQMLSLARLDRKNVEQKREFLHLGVRIIQLTQEIDKLQGFDRKRKAMMKMETREENNEFQGVGGFKTYQGLVGLMHRSLDNLNDEINGLRVKRIKNPPVLRNEKGQNIEAAGYTKEGVDKGNREDIRKQLRAQAIELDMEPRLALSMAKIESGFNPKLISPKGAIGVLQVMPRLAWHDFGVTREMLFDPQINIRVGLSWMKSLLNRFDQDLDLSLAAYNAGVRRVVKSGYIIPPIKETLAYVRKVKEDMKN